MKSTSNNNEYDEIINLRSLKLLITTTKIIKNTIIISKKLFLLKSDRLKDNLST